MISKLHIPASLIITVIICLGCKSDYEKEVENSKRIGNSLKLEILPSYDSLYNEIILKRKGYPRQLLLADSLFRATKEITNTIDSLIIVVEKIDSTGESREVGQQLLVNTSVGLKLTKGANSVYQYSLQLLQIEGNKINLKALFSKYKGYLGSDEFNQVYFSKSSSSFIIMTLRGLKNDLTKAAYISLNDVKIFTAE